MTPAAPMMGVDYVRGIHEIAIALAPNETERRRHRRRLETFELEQSRRAARLAAAELSPFNPRRWLLLRRAEIADRAIERLRDESSAALGGVTDPACWREGRGVGAALIAACRAPGRWLCAHHLHDWRDGVCRRRHCDQQDPQWDEFTEDRW